MKASIHCELTYQESVRLQEISSNFGDNFPDTLPSQNVSWNHFWLIPHD